MGCDIPSSSSMVGHLLVAMPEIQDGQFQQSVIYVTHHQSGEGAKGIVINKPTDKITCEEIIEQLKIPIVPNTIFPKILIGGPDHRMQGFILHTSEVSYSETQKITDSISLTTTQEILGEIAQGLQPTKYLVAIGCTSWAPGQMEEEIMSNLWLSVPSTNELLFDTPHDKIWEKAISQLGFTPDQFSPKAGKA